MSGDRAPHPTPDSDFDAEPILPDCNAVVAFAATSFGMMATPEEHEKVMLRIYGPDRLPGTETRRMSQEGLRCSAKGCERVPYRAGLCRDHVAEARAEKAAEAE